MCICVCACSYVHVLHMCVLSSWRSGAGGSGGHPSELYSHLLQLPPGTERRMSPLSLLHVALIKPLCCGKSLFLQLSPVRNRSHTDTDTHSLHLHMWTHRDILSHVPYKGSFSKISSGVMFWGNIIFRFIALKVPEVKSPGSWDCSHCSARTHCSALMWIGNKIP